ncbi:MAG TPA: outer membrane beta-barrel protein [Candidatus Limnocylindria bacterium]|nr:outer membrane beta-barrel protein [Candidatus Limnocylindria bacterium]
MMKKMFATVLVALALGSTTATAASIGIGAFGGASIPIVNDLSSNGSQFGVRVPVNLVPLLTVEPFFATSSLGNVEETFGPTTFERDGGKNTGFGANVLFTFGTGVQFFPFAGIGSYKIERDGSEDITDIGYNFGLGIGFSPIPKIGVNARGEFNMVTTDETSQKFANITLGASYSLVSMP